VDKIYAKLRNGPRGHRIRQANLSIDIARRAWRVVRRLHTSKVSAINPWEGVERDTSKQTKAVASRKEANALADALKQLGEQHLGAAALICFEWHQRPEHVRNGDITGRTTAQPIDAVQIRHHKTGEKGWVPLEDEEGQLLYTPNLSYRAWDCRSFSRLVGGGCSSALFQRVCATKSA
jgi:hypothetical protein